MGQNPKLAKEQDAESSSSLGTPALALVTAVPPHTETPHMRLPLQDTPSSPSPHIHTMAAASIPSALPSPLFSGSSREAGGLYCHFLS